ncbi:MAG: hypothetical protein H0V57_10490, partial [Thermoleophilaceae bacterium]|nr:hypothetical protein [Thermoleophilaceae bacterium]
PPPPTPEQPAPPGPTEPDPATEDKQEAPGAPTEEEKGRYERYCKMKDAEPSHSDKKFCEEYRKKYLQGQGAEEDEQNQPAGEKSDEPDSGPLAFTGLDIWQLVLLALVLVGGGLGARRLLAN